MSEPSESVEGLDDVEPVQRDLLEHLQTVEARLRERAAKDDLHQDNERLRATLAKNNVRTERNATARFLALCFLVALGLGTVLYLQVDSHGSGRLRSDLIRQCEVRNANTQALKVSLESASAAEDNLEVATNLAAAARTLQIFDCRTLH